MRKANMKDPWTDRLSEYIDGDLAADDVRGLNAHLAGCDTCGRLLEELRAVAAAARILPDRTPDRDLWTGIAAAIGAPGAADTPVPGALPWRSAAPRTDDAPPRRRFSFSMPQLAVAALLLMTVSAGTMWLVAGGAQRGGGESGVAGMVFQSAAAVPADVILVNTAPGASAPTDVDDVAGIEQALDAARSTLDPATVEVLERSIEAINTAIAQARAALEADPGNPHLQRQLESTMQRRQDVLRRAGGVQRGGA
jgi:anti-sigma factor RsiW